MSRRKRPTVTLPPTEPQLDAREEFVVRASDEILRAPDRLRWHLERDAADAEEGRSRRSKT
jgi:hypothetical protein